MLLLEAVVFAVEDVVHEDDDEEEDEDDDEDDGAMLLYSMAMSRATLTASRETPESPLRVKPTEYKPNPPFQPSGNASFGYPSPVKKSLP